MNNILKICSEYCTFAEDKAYVLLLIPRKKENIENTEKEKLGLLQRRIVRNRNEIIDAVTYFNNFTARFPEIVFRVYITVNRRDLSKGLFHLTQKMMDMQKDMFYGNKEVYDRIVKLSSTLKSTLCEKACRDTKYFHFDVDFENDTVEGKKDYAELLKHIENLTEVKYAGETLNGFAIITEPFNPQALKEIYNIFRFGRLDFPDNVELKPDSYLYLDVYNHKGKE